MIGLYYCARHFKTKNNERTPQWLIIEKLISQFCSLHSSIGIGQRKRTSVIHPTIMENTEDSLVKGMPHISVDESHNTLISAISTLIHSTIAVRSVSAIFGFCTEAITR